MTQHLATTTRLIEDYALIGDTHTAALVSKGGSIDWLCLPRFDSGACFAALLGDESNGSWLIAPKGGVRHIDRRYRGETLVLETEFETDDGVARVIDCMPHREHRPDLVRIVEGVRGRVPMHMRLIVRFDYGSIVPWVRRIDDSLLAVAGPDALSLRTTVPFRGENLTTVADFAIAAGDTVPFVLTWHPSHEPLPQPIDPLAALGQTQQAWTEWSARYSDQTKWRDSVIRSLITLKALTYAPTGGIVAAPTTSLPEQLGGVRNWDYRYCWLRDATFTLYSLLLAGYELEAKEWRQWLLRAVAGEPSKMQLMYGAAGERRLPEWEVGWLSGYEHSRPVRVGNAAVNQWQLDVYGELMDSMHQAREEGIEEDHSDWNLQRAIMDFLESSWRDPEEGIWEMRGPRRQFTHSKVMAWVAVDRAIAAVERFGMDGPAERWKRLRAEIHAEVCSEGYDPDRKTFTQYYGSSELDASLLMIPLVGFLPARDERVEGTIAAIQEELCRDGFVMRYLQERENVDGLPPGEGAFIACSFWLADNLALVGRHDEALEMFERLLAIRNDVGLLSEEYDVAARRLLGNFPQAFSHVALVNAAHNLSSERRQALLRSRRVGHDAASRDQGDQPPFD